MTPLELTLLGIVGAAIFGCLFLRAQWAKDKESKKVDDKADRIDAVAQEYVRLFRSHQSSNLPGMLRADVLSLQSDDEVDRAFDAIAQSGVPHPIPQVYRGLLEGFSTLAFFRILNDRQDQMMVNRHVIAMIQELREESSDA